MVGMLTVATYWPLEISPETKVGCAPPKYWSSEILPKRTLKGCGKTERFVVARLKRTIMDSPVFIEVLSTVTPETEYVGASAPLARGAETNTTATNRAPRILMPFLGDKSASELCQPHSSN